MVESMQSLLLSTFSLLFALAYCCCFRTRCPQVRYSESRICLRAAAAHAVPGKRWCFVF